MTSCANLIVALTEQCFDVCKNGRSAAYTSETQRFMEHQYAELKLPRLSGVTTAVYDLLDKDSASIYIGPPYGMHSVRGMHITRPDLAGRILQFNSMPYSMLAHSKSSAYTMCVLQQQSPIVIVESWDAKNDKHAEYLSRIVEILKPRGIVNLSSGHY